MPSVSLLDNFKRNCIDANGKVSGWGIPPPSDTIPTKAENFNVKDTEDRVNREKIEVKREDTR